MIYRKRLSFYKTHEPITDLYDGLDIEGKYIVEYYGELWNGKTFTSDGRMSFLSEGESITYIVKDKEFLNEIEPEFEDFIWVQNIDKNYENISIYFIKVREQEILESTKIKNRRRWLNQMEIDHD